MRIQSLSLFLTLLTLTGCQSRVSEPLWTFQADQTITAASFNRDGSRLALAGEDGKIWILDATGKPTTLTPGPESASFLIFSSDGRWLAAASDKRRDVGWWNVEDGRLLASVDAGKAAKAAKEISHEAFLWVDARTGRVSRKSTAYIGGKAGTTVAGLAFSENHLLSTDTRGTVEVWSSDGELTRVLGIDAIVSAAQVSPAGDRLALSGGNRLRVVDLSDGKVAFQMEGNSDFRPVVFSPTGDYLAASSLGQSKLVSLASKAVALNFPDSVMAYDFSNDGRYLACASSNKVTIWNVNTKTVEGELSVRGDAIHVLDNGHGLLVRQESRTLFWELGQPEPTWSVDRAARRWAVSSDGLVALILDEGRVECWQPPVRP